MEKVWQKDSDAEFLTIYFRITAKKPVAIMVRENKVNCNEL